MVKDFARPFVNNLVVYMVAAQNQIFVDVILVSVVKHAKMLDAQVRKMIFRTARSPLAVKNQVLTVLASMRNTLEW